jgi:hypothetical protein
VVKIGPGLWNPGIGWILKTSGTDYAIWEKEVIADVPSLAITPTGGNFVTGNTVNVVLTANNATSTIYYTLNGTNPTTSSLSSVGTKSLSLTSTTTLKAFVRNTAGVNSAARTEIYNFSSPPTFTVYFKKPTNWSSAVKIYYWGTTGTAPAVAWPGVAMTIDCGSWYRFTFPSTVSASNIIFNDGTLQTADLNTNAGIRYYDNGWLSGAPANRCQTTLTVYFKPPTSWGTVVPRIHYWNALPTGSIANTTWPGIRMVADVNGFYKYTIVGPTSVNIVFNNGRTGTGNQTPNLLNKTDGYSYTWGAAARTSNPENSANKVVVYPNPVSDILQITSESTIQDYKLITVQGTVLQKGKSVESGIDMSSLNSGLYLIQLRFENGEEETRKIFKR